MNQIIWETQKSGIELSVGQAVLELLIKTIARFDQ